MPDNVTLVSIIVTLVSSEAELMLGKNKSK
jgi:hypothetical protein